MQNFKLILFLDCFYVPFFLDNDKLESFVAKPVRDDKMIDIKGSSNDNLRTKKLTAFVGPTSPIKVFSCDKNLFN